jgi:hypothetical protein
VAPYIQIRPTEGGYGIPFFRRTETRGYPYALDLSFIAKVQPDVPIVLKRVTLEDYDGMEHVLLDKEKTLPEFSEQTLCISETTTTDGFYGDAFVTKWCKVTLPLEFKKNASCRVKAEFTIGDRVYDKEWTFRTILMTADRSWYRVLLFLPID